MEESRIGFLFSGQGAQLVGMGRSLYESEPVARDLYDCAEDILGWDLKRVSFEGPMEELTETRFCQPALYVHGMAVFAVLRERGFAGAAAGYCGLSVGELTALAAAGAVDFETGLRLVRERANLMQEACEATAGSMASVIGGTREQVEDLCHLCGVEIANLNCPGQIVISGPVAGIDEAVGKGRDFGFKLVKKLQVAGAYHSRLMESARDGFAPVVAAVEMAEPSGPVYANVDGRRSGSVEEIRRNIVEQIVAPVSFEDCVRNLSSDEGVNVFAECGPGGVLAGLLRRIDRDWTCHSIAEATDLALVRA